MFARKYSTSEKITDFFLIVAFLKNDDQLFFKYKTQLRS